MAQGFVQLLTPDELTVIVNVGDDDIIYGAHVSADLDSVLYTLAGIQGPHGWGIANDTFDAMERLSGLGTDTSFRLGDRDLARCEERATALNDGVSLSEFTRRLAVELGVRAHLLPASDDPVRTCVQSETGEWLSFQDYFVRRGQQDRVVGVSYEGAAEAGPTPGVIEAIGDANQVVITPSNPPLSIWPILAIPGIRQAIEAKQRVVAVSPLFGGRALKGPAAEVMASLGLGHGTGGILAAYEGLITDLVIDEEDASDIDRYRTSSVRIHAADTRIADPASSARLAKELLASTEWIPVTRTRGAV
jgi:LPPG:FO 2-phospho-L-lactate transferase